MKNHPRALLIVLLTHALWLIMSSAALADEPPDADSSTEAEGALAGESVTLDVDGDGDKDQLELEQEDGGQRIQVSLATGEQYQLGDAEHPVSLRFYLEEGEEEDDADFSWIAAWEPLSADDGVFQKDGPFPMKWEVPDAQGDALWVTSLDVAALLYWSEDGWVLLNLGY